VSLGSSQEAPLLPSLPVKVALLSTLYASQGLPYGFFTVALPVLLREQKATLTAIGLTSLLAFPWALKALWAPLIDRIPRVRGGRRRAAVLVLQGAAIVGVLALSLFDPERVLMVLLIGVVITNLIAATQDIATDALATEILTPTERGLGNGVQVGAYRLGMIAGGAGLLVVYERAGHAIAFVTMAALLALFSIPLLLSSTEALEAPPHARARGVAGSMLLGFLRREGVRPWVLVLVLYKGLDSYMVGMVKPLLVDQGIAVADIAWMQGGVGSGASLVGALLGGAFVTRLGRRPALLGFGALQLVCQALFLLPAMGVVDMRTLVTITVVENITGGMATVALFTWMMDRASHAQAGTDYTAQASVVVMAMGAGTMLSGLSADVLGHVGHLTLAAVLYAAALVVIARVLLPRAVVDAGGTV
jgi:PAT family beta-lactamase induction signal transducer AmpG